MLYGRGASLGPAERALEGVAGPAVAEDKLADLGEARRGGGGVVVAEECGARLDLGERRQRQRRREARRAEAEEVAEAAEERALLVARRAGAAEADEVEAAASRSCRRRGRTG